MPYLRTLMIENNPIEELEPSTWLPGGTFPVHPTATYPPSLRLHTIFLATKLTVLNSVPVIPEEKVAAMNTYNPPNTVSFSIQHMNNQRLVSKAYATITAGDLLRSKRLIPIVLCGPNGAGKR